MVVLAVPVLHELQHLPAAASGSGWTTTSGCSRTTRLHPVGADHPHLRAGGHPDQAGCRAGRRDAAELPVDRGAGFFRSAFYAPCLIGGSVCIAIVWRAMFSADGPVDSGLQLPRDQPGWLGRQPGPGLPDDDPAGRLAVRRPDGHLPGRAQADARRSCTRPRRVDGARPGASSAASPCRCSPR